MVSACSAVDYPGWCHVTLVLRRLARWGVSAPSRSRLRSHGRGADPSRSRARSRVPVPPELSRTSPGARRLEGGDRVTMIGVKQGSSTLVNRARNQSPTASGVRSREFTRKERESEARIMPVYVYQCQVCGSEQEVLHGITDKPKGRLHCAECGKRTPVVRLITALGGVATGQAKPPAL